MLSAQKMSIKLRPKKDYLSTQGGIYSIYSENHVNILLKAKLKSQNELERS